MTKKIDRVIKYTIIPRNDKEDYEKNFNLSLREFAKALDGKSLVAPLILYNTELDIPMDMDEEIEEYIYYVSKEDLVGTIRREENTSIFKCLILHGYDISLDEIRQIYCPISRRNDADICINVIQDSEINENLTFFLRNTLDMESEEEWEEDKIQIQREKDECIKEYLSYNDLSEEEMMDLLPFLMSGDLEEFDKALDNKRKQKNKLQQDKKDQQVKDFMDKVSYIPLPTNLDESMKRLEEVDEEGMNDIITCSYECNGCYVAMSKFDDDFYTIEDDDYEMVFTYDQIDFLMQAFNRIKDKPVENK